MDPWVVSNVLQPNLESTGFLDVSVIHTVRVENFLERAEQFLGMCFLSLSHSLSKDTHVRMSKRCNVAENKTVKVGKNAKKKEKEKNMI